MRSSNHYNNNGHVQFNIDGFQSEIRHHNRLSNFNNGKLAKKILSSVISN